MGDVRLASTVMLLRDGADGMEVFMVQRHRRSGFLPHAWVFPGGRVDDGDHLAAHPRIRGGARIAEQFGVAAELGVAHGICGVRETFEEAGVWLGDGTLPESLRLALHRGDVALTDVLDTHDAAVDLDALVPWSWWVTPRAEPKRYDTRFLAVKVLEAAGRHDEIEVVDSRWVRPRAVFDDAVSAADFPLAPPTWWTLRELAHFDTVDAALASPRPADRAIQPIMEFGDGGVHLYLPGHEGHGDAPIDGVPDRITFEEGAWVGWRGSQRV